MARRKNRTKRSTKTILRLPDLEQSKNAVLNSLAATSSQESYGHAIDEFIGWYCSEPRLAFNRAVVLRELQKQAREQGLPVSEYIRRKLDLPKED
jgi:hypothetical protein